MPPPAPTPFAPAVAVIPARLGSTRFPGKVLASATGKPMIRHVWEAAKRATLVREIVIATDDQRVCDAARAFGARAVMTRADHPNGTSRLGEASTALGLSNDTIVINVQGDEPELEPALIDALVETMRSTDAPVGTVASPFMPGEDPANPNLVKVVVGCDGRALYFSRAMIPFVRDPAGDARAAPLKHVGMYGYRVPFLRTYATLRPTPLEQTEMLEQLRVLEHGHSIAVCVREAVSAGIDTPEQYEAFVKRWKATNRG